MINNTTKTYERLYLPLLQKVGVKIMNRNIAMLEVSKKNKP